MMKSVVGIDIGSTALKVVELRGTWRGFEVIKAAERRLPTDASAACPLEEVIVDFAKVRDVDTGGCEVLAAAVPRVAMAEHLRILELAGLIPEVVDWEIFGELNSYLAWRPSPQSGPVALVNLGASKTTVKIIHDGSIRFTRSI